MTHCVDLEFLDVSNTDDYVNFVYEIWIIYLFDQGGGWQGPCVWRWYLCRRVAALINTCTRLMPRCQPDIVFFGIRRKRPALVITVPVKAAPRRKETLTKAPWMTNAGPAQSHGMCKVWRALKGEPVRHLSASAGRENRQLRRKRSRKELSPRVCVRASCS